MGEGEKTKDQLLEKLEMLHRRIVELEAAGVVRKQAEEELFKVNRALKALSDCNKTLIHAMEESKLMEDVCRIIVEDGGYRLAWVGFAEQDEAKTVRPMAQWGYEEGYLDTVRITWANTERGRGPTGTAIRTAKPSVVQDFLADPDYQPWRAEALRRGYASGIALPLCYDQKCFGALNIYLAESEALDADEVNLLTELANNLAYGVMALRMREERRRVEEALRESEERYRSLFKNNHSVMLLIDPESAEIVDANPAACSFYGWSPEELTSKKITDINMLTSEQVFQEMKRAQSEERQHFFFRHRLANREISDVEVYSGPIRVHGKELLYSIIHDITERKRAEEGLRQHVERSRILLEIDRAILAAQSPQAIADAALSQIRGLLPILARTSVAVFDPENDEARVLAVHTNGETRIGTEGLFSLEEFGIPEELHEGRTVMVEDLLLHPHHSLVDQALLEEGVRSIIIVPLLFQGELVGTLHFGAEEPGRFTEEHVEIAQEVAGQIAVAIKNAQLFNSVTEQREELRALAVRLEELEDTERRRLAQELHDSVGQNLTALSINLNFVRNLLPPGTDTAISCRLADCLSLLEETAERTRNVMAELRPSVLDDYGLIAALRWHAERFSARAELTTTLLPEQELKVKLSPAVETTIFRIVQEALTNAVKHARARQVTIQVEEVEGDVRLVIADDGVGFDPKIVRQPGGQPGWGLVTMRERAIAVGGHLSVNSEPGKGTQVVLEVRG